MDCDQSHNFHYYVMGALGAVHSFIEFWLGKSKKVRANSLLELLWDCFKAFFRKERTMSRATRTVEYEVEVDNVMALLVTLVSDLKAKKTLAQISADVLPQLGAAVTAVTGVAGDFADNRHEALETVGFRIGDLTDALLAPVAAPAPAATPAA